MLKLPLAVVADAPNPAKATLKLPLVVVVGVVSAALSVPMARAKLNKPPVAMAVAPSPMAIAHCNGPPDEHPVPNVPRPVAIQDAWAAGATLVASALAATAPNTPAATNKPADRD
jgi:hypothetical protein